MAIIVEQRDQIEVFTNDSGGITIKQDDNGGHVGVVFIAFDKKDARVIAEAILTEAKDHG